MTDPRVEKIRTQVAAGLAARARGDQATGGSGLTEPDRAALGHALIAEALQAEAEIALAAGRPVLDSADEDALARAVYDSLFGLAGFQPCSTIPRSRTSTPTGRTRFGSATPTDAASGSIQSRHRMRPLWSSFARWRRESASANAGSTSACLACRCSYRTEVGCSP